MQDNMATPKMKPEKAEIVRGVASHDISLLRVMISKSVGALQDIGLASPSNMGTLNSQGRGKQGTVPSNAHHAEAGIIGSILHTRHLKQVEVQTS